MPSLLVGISPLGQPLPTIGCSGVSNSYTSLNHLHISTNSTTDAPASLWPEAPKHPCALKTQSARFLLVRGQLEHFAKGARRQLENRLRRRNHCLPGKTLSTFGSFPKVCGFWNLACLRRLHYVPHDAASQSFERRIGGDYFAAGGVPGCRAAPFFFEP